MKKQWYSLNLKPDLNGSHLIHKHNCPFLPEYGHRISLGRFITPDDALKKGLKFSNSAKRCIFCSDYNPDEKIEAVAEITNSNDRIVGREGIRSDWVSGMLVGQN